MKIYIGPPASDVRFWTGVVVGLLVGFAIGVVFGVGWF